MITKNDVKLLVEHFENINTTNEDLNKLIKKLKLMYQIQECDDKLNELMKEGK